LQGVHPIETTREIWSSAGDRLGCVGRKEDGQCDIFWVRQILERLIRHGFGLDPVDGSTCGLCPPLEELLNTLSIDSAGRMALARMLWIPSSIESVFMKPIRPHLTVE
jgi:hypothetical protein